MKKSIILTFALALMMTTAFAQSYNALFYTAGNQNNTFAETNPQVLNYSDILQAIEYPEEAIDHQKEALIQISILVDQHGNYADHMFLSKQDAAFEAAINEQVKELKFEPATKNGKRIQAWVSIPFRFRMTK